MPLVAVDGERLVIAQSSQLVDGVLQEVLVQRLALLHFEGVLGTLTLRKRFVDGSHALATCVLVVHLDFEVQIRFLDLQALTFGVLKKTSIAVTSIVWTYIVIKPLT